MGVLDDIITGRCPNFDKFAIRFRNKTPFFHIILRNFYVFGAANSDKNRILAVNG